MDPLEIIRKYCDPESRAFYFLTHHGKLVARKALAVAERVSSLNPDPVFIEEAAVIHDIGIIFTDAPRLGCFGYKDYLCHGFLGRELLEKEGFTRHGLVCERHVGVGITARDVRDLGLPLPERDMVPVTLEEQIICYADKFFSKGEHDLVHEKPLVQVRETVRQYGEEKLRVFDAWVEKFGV